MRIRVKSRGFTLIEFLVALLLLALLTAAVGLSFGSSVRQVRADDSIAAVRQFDADARSAATARGEAVRIVFDLSQKTVSRFDGSSLSQLRARINVPTVSEVRVADQFLADGLVDLDFSRNGYSRSYAVHVGDRWISVAGLSGQTIVEDHAIELQNPSK